MANLNLSEFTEKLFVTDADHTFIWDTAASISKRVSRNSWLNSGTLTSDAPVTISQTWNNAAVTFTGLKFNAAGTSDANSASGSLLADFQVNGVSKFRVGKLTNAVVEFATNGNGATLRGTNLQFGTLGGTLVAGVTSSAFYVGLLEAPSYLFSDAANTLALRNGAAAQTFRVYGAYPDTGINYARLALSCDTSGNATISTQALGTYTAGTVSINGVPVGLGKGNVASNVAVGTQALNANTTGLQNTAIGISSLIANTSGQFNTTIGAYSMEFATIGNRNASLGASALLYNTTGSNNLAIGFESGRVIADGVTPAGSCNNSLFIGANTKPLNVSQTNQIVIGYNAIGIGSDSVVLGNDSITKTALKGNVGIGTTAPTSGLHVAGALGFDSTTYNSAAALKLTNTTGPNSWLLTSGIVAVSDSTFCIRQESTAIPALTIANNTNNVGIGTSVPAAKLHVAGNGRFSGAYPNVDLKPSAWATPFLFQSGTDLTGIGAGVYTIFSNPTAHGFSWVQGSTSRIVIDTSGNVGIGTTSPTSKLQVTNGDVEIETVTSGIIMKAAGTSTRYRITLNATGDALVFTAI